MTAQLALNLALREGLSFASYYPGPNALAAASIRTLAEEPTPADDQVHLWGAPATGKTHLLQAACRAAAECNANCAYLPLKELQSADSRALEDLESVALVCVDDLDVLAGKPEWEEGLFHAINAAKAAGHRLALASRQNPAHLELRLPDLRSRLLAGPVFHLQTLDDDAKLAALVSRAAQRGLDLPEAPGRYLLHNCRRDLGWLLELLDRLDAASLAAQRRITVPFIKTVLAASSHLPKGQAD